MASQQVRQILDSIRSFYHELAERFQQQCEHEKDEQLQLLLEHVAKREEGLSECLKQFEDDADNGLLDTWLQFGADSLTDILREATLEDGMSRDDVVEVAMRVDRRLIEVYRELSGECAVPHVCDMFADLIRLEEGMQRRLATSLREE